MNYKNLLLVGAIALISALTGCTSTHIKSPLVNEYPKLNVQNADLMARPTEYGIEIDEEIVSASASGKRFLWIPLNGRKHYTLNSRIVGSFSPGSSFQAEACKKLFDAHPDAEGLFVVRVVTESQSTILPGTGEWETTVYAKKMTFKSYGVMEPERADILKGMRTPVGEEEKNMFNIKLVK